eukprot:UN2440
MFADYIIQFLRIAMELAVKDFRDRVRETAGGIAEEWSCMVPEYMLLRLQLAEFERGFGMLLLASLFTTGWGTFLFLMASLDSSLAVGWRCACVCFCFVSASTVLEKLHPLAKITDLCRSTAAGSESLLTVAAEGVGREATVHSAVFTTHVLNFPTGVSLPGGFQVTTGLIMNCIKALVLYGSTAAYLALRFVVGGHGAQGASRLC